MRGENAIHDAIEALEELLNKAIASNDDLAQTFYEGAVAGLKYATGDYGLGFNEEEAWFY